MIGEEVKNIRRNNELNKILPKLQNNIRDKQFINNFNSKTRMIYCIDDKKLDTILGKNNIIIIDYNHSEYFYKYKIIKKGYITIRDLLHDMMNQNFYLDEEIEQDHIFIEGIDYQT